MTEQIKVNDGRRGQSNPILYQIGKWGGIAIITYYLLTEHREHVFQFLPYMLLLACPLMHFFMHGRHGSHDHHHAKQNERKDQP